MTVRKLAVTSIVSICLCMSCLMQSCQSIDKEKVKETVEKFFNAYRSEDISTAKSIYPQILSLRGQFRKTSSVDIELNNIQSTNDSIVMVRLTHHWVNPFGADNATEMRFYLMKKDNDYFIADSRNFCSFDDVRPYQFACKIGAINLLSDTTDIAVSMGIRNAEPMFYLAKDKIKNDIKNSLSVSSMNWEIGYYSDYASGRAIVANNTNYPISKPKYTVTYYKGKNEALITSDNGYVCYDVLMPGTSKSFSWYTSYVGNASWANVSVDCDESWIEEIAMNLPYKGDEYAKYCKENYWWPM